MPRVKRGVQARARHKKILAKARGYYGARSRVFRVAKQAVIKAGQYAYRDRRQRKRMFRRLWITRINAAAREYGLSYSRMMDGFYSSFLQQKTNSRPTFFQVPSIRQLMTILNRTRQQDIFARQL